MGNSMDKVLEGLYVGGFLGANQREKLLENKITHVLAIHDTAEAHHPQDFQYKCIKVSDTSSSDLTQYFPECVEFIHEARLKGGSVFVHCAAGISRSVTIVVMYIMTVSTLNFEEALLVVKHRREMANPNYGFRLQLKQYSEDKVHHERKRIQDKYPEMSALSDDTRLREVLTEAGKKPRSSSGSEWHYDTSSGLIHKN